MVVAPAVIRAGPRRLQRPPEVRQRKAGHLIGNAHLDRRVVERPHRRADLHEQAPLLIRLAAVRVEAAEAREEDLPRRAQLRAQADDAGDLFQLVADLRLREHGRERRAARRRLQQRVERQRVAHRLVSGLNHLIAAAGGENLLLRGGPRLRRRRRPEAQSVLV